MLDLLNLLRFYKEENQRLSVDKDGNPWLDKTMIKELGNRGQGINTGN